MVTETEQAFRQFEQSKQRYVEALRKEGVSHLADLSYKTFGTANVHIKVAFSGVERPSVITTHIETTDGHVFPQEAVDSFKPFMLRTYMELAGTYEETFTLSNDDVNMEKAIVGFSDGNVTVGTDLTRKNDVKLRLHQGKHLVFGGTTHQRNSVFEHYLTQHERPVIIVDLDDELDVPVDHKMTLETFLTARHDRFDIGCLPNHQGGAEARRWLAESITEIAGLDADEHTALRGCLTAERQSVADVANLRDVELRKKILGCAPEMSLLLPHKSGVQVPVETFKRYRSIKIVSDTKHKRIVKSYLAAMLFHHAPSGTLVAVPEIENTDGFYRTPSRRRPKLISNQNGSFITHESVTYLGPTENEGEVGATSAWLLYMDKIQQAFGKVHQGQHDLDGVTALVHDHQGNTATVQIFCHDNKPVAAPLSGQLRKNAAEAIRKLNPELGRGQSYTVVDHWKTDLASHPLTHDLIACYVNQRPTAEVVAGLMETLDDSITVTLQTDQGTTNLYIESSGSNEIMVTEESDWSWFVYAGSAEDSGLPAQCPDALRVAKTLLKRKGESDGAY